LPTYSFDLKAASLIKKAIDIPIVFFGSYVSIALEETIMHQSVDIVVTGEPENTFVDLCLKGKAEATGIWYKNNEGKIIKNKFSEYVTCRSCPPFLALDDWIWAIITSKRAAP
jgi:hypothetical protein